MALGTVNVGRPMNPAEFVKTVLLAAANGVATLDENGKLVAAQKPSYSKNDVGLGNVDNTSDADKPVSAAQAAAIAEAKNVGANIQTNLDAHAGNKSNPHGVSKTQIGLDKVDNTSDAEKPVSTAQATAIAEAKKAGTDAQTNLEAHIANKSNPHGLSAEDIGARPTTWTPSAADVGADPVGTASAAVGSHNTDASAHNDIRLFVTELMNRVNALADSDDTTLDQLSEIVAYIKANKTLIDSVTTSKVSVTDIVNDLATNVANKPLSAAQGVALKAMIDTLTVDSALSDTSEKPVQNKVVKAAIDQLDEHKAESDHDHTPEEIGAAPADHTHTAEEVGAASMISFTYVLSQGDWQEGGTYPYYYEAGSEQYPDNRFDEQSTIFISPVPDNTNLELYTKHNIRCVEQGAGYLVFVADTDPNQDDDIAVNITIFR